jgi:proteasome lid subunit RPN8/RPN11
MHIKAYRKIFAYAKIAAPDEVLGLLSVTDLPDGGIMIDDVLLPTQTVTCGSCHLKVDKVITDYPNPEKLKGWWHSHHSMGTFHSGTDDETLYNWGGPKTLYSLSIVVSLPNEMKCWLQYFNPIETEKKEVPLVITFGEEIPVNITIGKSGVFEPKDVKLDEDSFMANMPLFINFGDKMFELCKEEASKRVSKESYSFRGPYYGGPEEGWDECDRSGYSKRALEQLQEEISDNPIVPLGQAIKPVGKLKEDCGHVAVNRRGTTFCDKHGAFKCKDCRFDTRKIHKGKHKPNKIKEVFFENCMCYEGLNEISRMHECSVLGVILDGCSGCTCFFPKKDEHEEWAKGELA